MALTIAMEGKGVIANADSLTADTAGYSGTWSELGGGSIAVNNDVYLYGSASIGSKYASKSGWTYYDIQSGNELDFSASGTEEDEFLWFWINIQSAGAFDSLANKGFAIRCGSGTTDYREWIIAGNDDSNGWTGGWKLFVIDPTKAGSVTDTGSPALSSMRYFGIWLDTIVSVRAESVFMSQIWCGKGLRITGTSTQGWKDVADWCTAYSSRAHGAIQVFEEEYFAHGGFWIGDAVNQSANVSFKDSDARNIKFGKSEYYNSSSAWVESYPNTAQKIVIEDHTSYTTEFEDGIIVGTDGGRSGTTFKGNDVFELSIDLYGGNNAGSLTRLYGTNFRDVIGGIGWGNDADHRFYGGTVIGCGQFDPVGAPQIRNVNFIGTVDSYGGTNPDGSALLWNSNIDIQYCNFIANTHGTYNPHAIQVDAAGTINFSALFFSGNDFDVHFTPASGDLTVNKLLSSDPASSDVEGTGSVSFVANYSFTVTGLELNTEVTIVTADTTTVLHHTENATTSDGDGKYQITYSHSGGASVDVLIHHISYQPDLNNIYGLSLPNANSSAKVSMFSDVNYENPT